MQTEFYNEEDPETAPEEKAEPLSEAEKAETLRRLEKMSALHALVEADARRMEAFLAALPEFFEREDALVDYYYAQWGTDYQHENELGDHPYHGILNQDTIWDTMQSLHDSSMGILRALINHVAPRE